MADKLQELATMNYDPKKIEVCVTDGYSTDKLVDVLKAAAPIFYQVKYAKSDREALPFIVPENNPACDINAQICHVASFDKIVRTDAEVRFINKDSLNYIDKKLNSDKELCIPFRSRHVSKGGKLGSGATMSFHCSCFWKQAFIRNGGVEENFAKGFAAEDSYFHRWWRRNRHLCHPPSGYEVKHLWHGDWRTPNRLKLKKDYTMPLYLHYLKINRTPNIDNPDWQRPEMIKDVQIWKA